MSIKDMTDSEFYSRFGYGGADTGGTTTKTVGGVSTQGALWTKCDHYGDGVVRFNDTTVRAANSSGIGPAAEISDLVIDLAGVYTPTSKFATGAGADELNKLIHTPAYLRLDWRDMGVPPVRFAFWKVLLAQILKHKEVTVCCVGGHGRTGTCIAALLLAFSSAYSHTEAIEWVRKEHCKKAIETKGQEEYLRLIAAERDALKGGGVA